MPMTGVSLPTSLSAAISSIRWPLGPTSCPPLYFQAIEEMKVIRKASPERSPLDEFVSELPRSIDKLLPCDDEDRRHFGLVSVALILLGNGFTDEAHDIVTPLSWPEDTHFGYGPSVYSKVSVAARSIATYTHCLVHRREAFNIGEFGMMGFANANYWSNAALKSPGVTSLPHAELRRQFMPLIQQYTSPSAQDWCKRHDILEAMDEPYFESRAVHELCANVLRDDGTNPELRDFAEHVAEMEVRVLLWHALQRAGYEVDLGSVLKQGCCSGPNEKSDKAPVDEMVALSAAKRVSSAHLNSFKANGVMTLREVLSKRDRSYAFSAAAGVACRLMGSPACRLVDSIGSDDILRIALPISIGEAELIESDNEKPESGGGPLSPGDLRAEWESPDATTSDGVWFLFAACEATDEAAFFVDRLFGSRGETPTTVVQWSKGTIF